MWLNHEHSQFLILSPHFYQSNKYLFLIKENNEYLFVLKDAWYIFPLKSYLKATKFHKMLACF